MRPHLLCSLLIAGCWLHGAGEAPSVADPARFEAEIVRFEEAAGKTPVPAGAIVAVGSSSMRGWKTIQEDLAPLTVVPRGFGGSTMNDLLHYTDRLIVANRPRAVLIYEGDNDIAGGATPEQVRVALTQVVEKVHAALPECRIYVLAIKPSPKRWDKWPVMKLANELLKDTCAANDKLTWIDVASPMLQKNGQVRPELFADDRLHLNADGYALWKMVVKPLLLAREIAHETGEVK